MLRVRQKGSSTNIICWVAGAFILLLLSQLLDSTIQTSSARANEPDWFSDHQDIGYSAVIDTTWGNFINRERNCTKEQIIVKRDNAPVYASAQGCVIYGKNVRVATDVENSIYLHVSIGIDDKFYPIANMRASSIVLRFFSDSDQFLAIQPAIDRSIGSYISLHDSITDRLHRQHGGSYRLDISSPFVFPGTDESQLYAKGYGFSSNSKFLAYGREYPELHTGDRITKLNLETGEHKIVGVGYKAVWWNPGMSEYGISDSGGYIVSNGYILNVQNCGVDITYDVRELSSPCSKKRYYTCPDPSECRRRHVQFDGEYKFRVIDGVNNLKEVTYLADDYESGRLEYLALGDSISSGEGDTDFDTSGRKYYRLFTDIDGIAEDTETGTLVRLPKEKCHLSTRSYPHLFAAAMALSRNPNRGWDSVACSGAKAIDVRIGSSYQGQTQGGLIHGEKPRLEGFSSREAYQAHALDAMIPGRIEQIKFVKKYRPKIITLTMGANDIDFGGKLKGCLALPGTCDWATTKKETLASQIQGLYDTLLPLYRELSMASGGQAKIYVLGYPQLINKAEPASCGSNIGLLNKEEREMIYDATEYLNLVIERAANAAGAKYVNISDALIGGRLCDEGQAYVTGVAFRGSNELQETFHPNHYGHMSIASKARQNLDNKTLYDYDVCAGRLVNCLLDGEAIEKPAIPVNMGGAPVKPSKNLEMTLTAIIKSILQPITLSPLTLRPNSDVEIELHSSPVSLGQFTADASGGMNENITVPSYVPAGYHTLVVSGETYSGEPIELMQTVLVMGSNPDDLDEDGALDNQQPCGAFLSASGQDIDGDDIDDACDPFIGKVQQSVDEVEKSENKKKEIIRPSNKQDIASNHRQPQHNSKQDIVAEDSVDEVVKDDIKTDKEPNREVAPRNGDTSKISESVEGRQNGASLWYIIGGIFLAIVLLIAGYLTIKRREID